MSIVLLCKRGFIWAEKSLFYCKKGIEFVLKSQCFIMKKGSFWAEKSVFCHKKGGHFQTGEQEWVPLFPVSEGAGGIALDIQEPSRQTLHHILITWPLANYWTLSCATPQCIRISHTAFHLWFCKIGPKRIHKYTVVFSSAVAVHHCACCPPDWGSYVELI